MSESKFLNYSEAVKLSELLIAFFNTNQGREALTRLGQKFDLKLKNDYFMAVKQYERNCPDCSGCSDKGCVLGCFKTPQDTVCYWDEALEKIIGTKLVTHEIAHVAFDQAFDIEIFNDDQKHEISEKFAQYTEENFTDNLIWCAECKQFEVLEIDTRVDKMHGGEIGDQLLTGFVWGIGFGIATTLVGVGISKLVGKKT